MGFSYLLVVGGLLACVLLVLVFLLDDPVVPLRPRAGDWWASALPLEHHLVGCVRVDRGLDVLEHSLGDAHALHDLPAELGSTTTITQEGVEDVDDDLAVALKKHHAAQASVVVPKELHAGRRHELLRGHHHVLGGEDPIQLAPGVTGVEGDGFERVLVLVDQERRIRLGTRWGDRVDERGRCGEVGHF